MSLLLEALKKAEQEKKKRAAHTGSDAAGEPTAGSGPGDLADALALVPGDEPVHGRDNTVAGESSVSLSLGLECVDGEVDLTIVDGSALDAVPHTGETAEGETVAASAPDAEAPGVAVSVEARPDDNSAGGSLSARIESDSGPGPASVVPAAGSSENRPPDYTQWPFYADIMADLESDLARAAGRSPAVGEEPLPVVQDILDGLPGEADSESVPGGVADADEHIDVRSAPGDGSSPAVVSRQPGSETLSVAAGPGSAPVARKRTALEDEVARLKAGRSDSVRLDSGAGAPRRRAAQVLKAQGSKVNPLLRRRMRVLAVGMTAAVIAAAGIVWYFKQQLAALNDTALRLPPAVQGEPGGALQTGPNGDSSPVSSQAEAVRERIADVTAEAEELASVKRRTENPARAVPAPPQREAASVVSGVPRKSEKPVGKQTGLPKAPARKRSEVTVSVESRAQRVFRFNREGYEAYRQGDIASAAKAYRQALTLDPRNRDALLGLAAVSAAQGRPEQARQYYQRLLALNPGDEAAIAGLYSVTEGNTAPASESELRFLIDEHGPSPTLNFALGNVLAQQKRWGEAQQAYFEAFNADNRNPDYAYNLAVSLDHLGKPRLALRYYQVARKLARERRSGVDMFRLEARINQLQRSIDEGR